MADYERSTYGELIADVYDELTYSKTAPKSLAAVEFLASVAGKRRVLELGIGTGRVAIPLGALGLKVHGIDISPKIVARMREKPGGDVIPVEIGNFADVKIGGKFSLIYVVFNTLFMLLTQAEQVRCFQRVARHLTDDGVFVLEAFVPDHSHYDHGQRVGNSSLGVDRVVLDVATHDAAEQMIQAAHVDINEQGIKIYPIKLRYAWPAELDLMAQLAGMRLRARHGGWNREPFSASSQFHVSVYELVPAPAPVAPPKKRQMKRPARQRA
jgi:SAM-dependent methyltransferase